MLVLHLPPHNLHASMTVIEYSGGSHVEAE
jgi:hypothetical protein